MGTTGEGRRRNRKGKTESEITELSKVSNRGSIYELQWSEYLNIVLRSSYHCDTPKCSCTEMSSLGFFSAPRRDPMILLHHGQCKKSEVARLVHAMQACRRRSVMPLIRNFGARSKWLASRPGSFTQREKSTGTHRIGGCVSLRGGTDGLEKSVTLKYYTC